MELPRKIANIYQHESDQLGECPAEHYSVCPTPVDILNGVRKRVIGE